MTLRLKRVRELQVCGQMCHFWTFHFKQRMADKTVPYDLVCLRFTWSSSSCTI